jgi:LacI family transcriptional regulator
MAEDFAKAGIPLILIENQMEKAHSITIDNEKAASKAAERFIKTGKKNICLVIGEAIQPPSINNNMPAVQRRKGFVETLEKAGYKMPEKNIEVIHEYGYEEGRRSLDNFVAKGVKPDAIFCAAGDILAMGILERAGELGIKIPGDMAVIGFDDVVAARHLNPPLTTLRQPLDEVGVMAFDLACEAVEGKVKNFRHIVIDPELIVRKSG